jgi:hypothetical protein
MARPRAVDDFAAIRARMDELQREREQNMRRYADQTAGEAYPRHAVSRVLQGVQIEGLDLFRRDRRRSRSGYGSRRQ